MATPFDLNWLNVVEALIIILLTFAYFIEKGRREFADARASRLYGKVMHKRYVQDDDL